MSKAYISFEDKDNGNVEVKIHYENPSETSMHKSHVIATMLYVGLGNGEGAELHGEPDAVEEFNKISEQMQIMKRQFPGN